MIVKVEVRTRHRGTPHILQKAAARKICAVPAATASSIASPSRRQDLEALSPQVAGIAEKRQDRIADIKCDVFAPGESGAA